MSVYKLKSVGEILQSVRVGRFVAPLLFFLVSCSAWAQEQSVDQGAVVLQEFQQLTQDSERANEFSTEEKHQVMFIMGILLLVLLLATALLGVAMGIYEKPVYLPHMVCAGLSVTLAIVHSVVAIVWFYPF